MPETVFMPGKQGSILMFEEGGVGGTQASMIASWKTCEVGVTVTTVDQNGPYDDWDYQTAIRAGMTITIDNFVVNSSHLARILPPTGLVGWARVYAQTDLAGGNTVKGSWTVMNINLGNSEEAGTQNITLKSFGSITLI